MEHHLSAFILILIILLASSTASTTILPRRIDCPPSRLPFGRRQDAPLRLAHRPFREPGDLGRSSSVRPSPLIVSTTFLFPLAGTIRQRLLTFPLMFLYSSQTPPSTLLRLAATLVSQSILAYQRQKLSKETFLPGLSYFSQPLLSWAVVGIIHWITREIRRLG
jgi:hypothetical protein